MRVLVVGASTEPVCGVRDCARALEDPLAAAGIDTTTLWLDDPRTLPRALGQELIESSYDAVLYHYSPFTYAWRGLPTRVPGIARALRRAPVPVVAFLHELAPRLFARGWRGVLQTASLRAALAPLLYAVDAAIVASPGRVRELGRPWLPRRRVEFVPLLSNVDRVATRNGHANGGTRVGVFGFRHGTLDAELAVDATAELGDGVRLVLVGAPGPEGPHADRWRTAAARAGVPLEFTGVLDGEALSRALVSLDVVLSPDPAGPAPRRGTLAASLAHGLPVLALDGPEHWQRLSDEGALVVADERGFAPALARLAASAELRRHHGERARAFYDDVMAPDVVARRIAAVLAETAR